MPYSEPLHKETQQHPNPNRYERTAVQPKLVVGRPDDQYEREADAVADRVVMMPNTGIDTHMSPGPVIPGLQMKCAACEQEEKLHMQREEGTVRMKSEATIQTKTAQKRNANRSVVSPGLTGKLQSRKGLGQPLPVGVGQELASKIGADFSQVKIHTDSAAIQMSRELHAQAFTHGNDIYFNSGKYDTNTSKGQHLLAHELTHVRQQQGNSVGLVQREEDCEIRGGDSLFISGGIPPGLDCELNDVSDDQQYNCCGSDIQALIPSLYQRAKGYCERAIQRLDGGTHLDSAIWEHFGAHALSSRRTILANVRQISRELNNQSSHLIICRAKPCITFTPILNIYRNNPELFCRRNVAGSYEVGTNKITLCTNINGNLASDSWVTLLHEVVHLTGIGDLPSQDDATPNQRAAGEFETYQWDEENYPSAFSLRNADSYAHFIKVVGDPSFSGDSTAAYIAPNVTLGALTDLSRFRPGMTGRLTWSVLGRDTQFIVGANGIWFPPSTMFDPSPADGLRAYTGAELGLQHIFPGSVGGHIELAAGAGTYITESGAVDLGVAARLSGGVRFGGPGLGVSINADVQRILQIDQSGLLDQFGDNWYGGLSITGRWGGSSARPR